MLFSFDNGNLFSNLSIYIIYFFIIFATFFLILFFLLLASFTWGEKISLYHRQGHLFHQHTLFELVHEWIHPLFHHHSPYSYEEEDKFVVGFYEKVKSGSGFGEEKDTADFQYKKGPDSISSLVESEFKLGLDSPQSNKGPNIALIP